MLQAILRKRGHTASRQEEFAMNIVYAAEIMSIPHLLGEHLEQRIEPAEVQISENPEETGSFYVGWHLERFLLSPDGTIDPDTLFQAR